MQRLLNLNKLYKGHVRTLNRAYSKITPTGPRDRHGAARTSREPSSRSGNGSYPEHVSFDRSAPLSEPNDRTESNDEDNSGSRLAFLWFLLPGTFYAALGYATWNVYTNPPAGGTSRDVGAAVFDVPDDPDKFFGRDRKSGEGKDADRMNEKSTARPSRPRSNHGTNSKSGRNEIAKKINDKEKKKPKRKHTDQSDGKPSP